jgi:hypothetical protein
MNWNKIKDIIMLFLIFTGGLIIIWLIIVAIIHLAGL